MLSIALSYTEATRTLALTSSDTSAGNGGTTADTGSVQMTVTGIPSGYAAQLDFGVRVRDAKGRVMTAYQTLAIAEDGTTGTLTVDNAILYATILDGKLPVQLVITNLSAGLITASRNIVELDVAPAIDALRSNIRAYSPNIAKAFVDATISNGVMSFIDVFDDVIATVDITEGKTPVYWTGVLASTASWVSDDSHLFTAKTADERFATISSLAGHTGRVDNPHAVTKAQVGLGNCNDTSDADKPVSTAQAAALAAHTGRTDNPHAVTKAQVGLGNVDNTSDADKPISTATQTALGLKANAADLGTAAAKNTGIAEGNIPILGANGKLADSVLPPIAINEYAGAVGTKAELMTLTTTLSGRATGLGDWANVTSETGDNIGYNGSWILSGSDPTVLTSWRQMYAVGGEGGTVYSVNGRVGIVTLTKDDVGLGNVDNTSDADKPVSTAMQTALDAKQSTLMFDSTPTSASTNPVTSGGVYTSLSAKQNTITRVAVTLASASWSSSAQTVTVTGMTSALTNFDWGFQDGQSMDIEQAFAGAYMYVSAKGANSVTITCQGDVPTVDIIVEFVIMG